VIVASISSTLFSQRFAGMPPPVSDACADLGLIPKQFFAENNHEPARTNTNNKKMGDCQFVFFVWFVVKFLRYSYLGTSSYCAGLCGSIYSSADSHGHSVNTAGAVLCASAPLPVLPGFYDKVAFFKRRYYKRETVTSRGQYGI
jgi:hypothetical protein